MLLRPRMPPPRCLPSDIYSSYLFNLTPFGDNLTAMRWNAGFVALWLLALPIGCGGSQRAEGTSPSSQTQRETEANEAGSDGSSSHGETEEGSEPESTEEVIETSTPLP